MNGKQVLLTGGTGGLGLGVTPAVLAQHPAGVTITAKDIRGAAIPVYGSI